MNESDKHLSSGGVSSPNFGFLAALDPVLAQYGAKAERYVFDDPAVALLKIRQFAEVLAQQAAAHTGLFTSPEEPLADLLRRLKEARITDFEVADLFHAIRVAGNRAVHENVGTQRDALHHLRMAWRLGVWFQRAFKDHSFKAGPFIPPPDPLKAEKALVFELDQLRQAVADHQAKVQDLAATAEQEALLRAEAEAKAEAAYQDLTAALELAEETEAQAAKTQHEFEERLAARQAHAVASPANVAEAAILLAHQAAETLNLDESETLTTAPTVRLA